MTDTARPARPGAFVAPADLGVVEVTGEDRASYLNGVLTQDIAGLGPGQVAGSLQLDQHGRPLALMDVAVLADRILLLTATRGLAEELATSLGSRTFLADARFAALDHDARALRGDDVGRVVATIGLDVPAGAVVEQDEVVVVGRDDGVDLVGPSDALAALADRMTDAGAEPAGPEVLDAWRVAHGRPAWAREVRAPHLPEEAGLLPTHVHLAKGCYPGQEAVARMWMLGRPRRRLARVLLVGEADAGWAAGSGKQAVEVTSAAEWGGERVGLAYVPATAQPGDRFEEDGSGVVIRALIGEDLPIPGHDPSVARRRDRPRR